MKKFTFLIGLLLLTQLGLYAQTIKGRVFDDSPNIGDVLASVSSIGSRQLKDIPLNSAEESLAGRLAGVQVTGSEGSPNAQVLIRVRGGGSITRDNSPFI